MLTERQKAILEFVRQQTEKGVSPTVREIARHFGFASTNAVHSHLQLLEKKGEIRREAGRTRNIVLNRPAREDASFAKESLPQFVSRIVEIPLLGMIPAGLPDTMDLSSERTVAVDTGMIPLPPSERTFALEVRGDSMINAGILDRDIVILEVTPPRHRDIVAALIDGDTTLKRYLLQPEGPFLRAENPEYPDLIPAQELIIQGVFRALLRINRARL